MNEQEQQEVLEIYTNSVRVAASVYEFILEFRLQTPGEGERKIARVRMSPQHALALLYLLEKNTKAYGEQFKEIFLPDELVKRLTEYEEAGVSNEEYEQERE